MDIVQRRRHLWRMKTKDADDDDEDDLELMRIHSLPKCDQLNVEGDILSYSPDETLRKGVYIWPNALTEDCNYFEIEILDSGTEGSISIGLVPYNYSLKSHTWWNISYDADDGAIYRSNTSKMYSERFLAQTCVTGDRMGCGLKFDQMAIDGANRQSVLPAYLTKNGKEVRKMLIQLPVNGLFPAISLRSCGEEVKMTMGLKHNFDEDSNMSVDGNEDDWQKLHDIRLNGPVLEYAGRGRSIADVGLALAKYPLDTTSHYFEIEIVDPGQNCYIAIGLARKDYPKHRHPGWNKGSIAYHADDGKLFTGAGSGESFGPRCNQGDVMGCGIIFPRNYVLEYDSDVGSNDFSPSPPNGLSHYFEYDDFEEPLELDNYEDSASDSEDDEWWKQRGAIENGTIVKVFFTRNGMTIGSRSVCIPKGGFHPVIGMLSSDEKVRVDLHPLSG